MLREWYYTQGQEKFGPVSAAELRGLLDSGRLQAADLVWKQGMTQWLPVSVVAAKLFGAGKPSGGARAFALTCVILACVLALAGGTLAVLAAWKTMTALSIAAAVVAGLAVLPGLVVFGIALSSRRNLAYMGSAATATLLGATAVLFSIGAIVAKDRLDEAKKTIEKGEAVTAKAAEVEEEKRLTEVAARKAKDHREAAEAALEEARRPATKLLAEATREREKNAEILEKIVKEQADLEAKRAAFTKRDEALAKSEEAAKMKLAEGIDKLEEGKKALADAETALAKADKANKEAEERQRDAKKKEEAALEYQKKIADEFKKLRGSLASSKDAKKIIAGLARIDRPPSEVPVDLTGLHHDLCTTAVMNPSGLRPEALVALKNLEPRFGAVVDNMLHPKLDRDARLTPPGFQALTEGIMALPEFGAAGLSLIEGHFDLKAKGLEWLSPSNPVEIKLSQRIFDLEVEALYKMGMNTSEKELKTRVIDVLAKCPDSKLAMKAFSSKHREDPIRTQVQKLVAELAAK